MKSLFVVLLQRLNFRTVVIVYYCLTLLASLIGWVLAGHTGAQIGLAEMHRPLAGTIWRDFMYISKWNVSLAGGLLLGVCTLGVFTLLELIWNGIHHGFDLYLLSHGCMPALKIFLRYALLEMFSLTLIAAAAQALSLNVIRSLLLNVTDGSTKTILLALLGAFLMLITAAAIEANMKPLLQTLPC